MQTYEQQNLQFGGDASTSLREDSPASRSAWPGNGSERRMTATCGRKCLEQFVKFVPAGSWARTFPESLVGRTDWCSSRRVLTWKMKASRSGRLYFRLVPSMPRTAGTEFGLSPTVMTQGLKIHGENGSLKPMPVSMLPTPTAIDAGGGRINRSLSPNASERPTLGMAAKIGLLPTPTANDARNVSLPASQSVRKSGIVKVAMQSGKYRTGTGSRLNPRYVAEMMGFPPNWTESPFRHGAGNPSRLTEMP